MSRLHLLFCWAHEKGSLITLADAVVAEKRPDGKVKLHQLHSPGRSGATAGTLWGA
ncbi:hypothetical protein [Thermoactinospora rubra]|uniref:hypothetical protein n=1 Tax=Thermoactinospora rubra TaxID=1088767 RepID=UPI0019825061|nr:hypothetical protein [Thermoactinospora rubra]